MERCVLGAGYHPWWFPTHYLQVNVRVMSHATQTYSNKISPQRWRAEGFELVSFDLLSEPVTTPRSEERTSCLSHIPSRSNNRKISSPLILASVVA